jgi:heme-degrading monooxygenase HmoA
MLKHLTLALCALALTIPAHAPATPADAPVAVLVVVKTPPGVSRARIEAGFEASVPLYQKLPGLIRKYFTVNDDGFGGMYLWKNRAAADAWFNAAWRAKAKATYGTEPQVSYFDVPRLLDNSAATAAK